MLQCLLAREKRWEKGWKLANISYLYNQDYYPLAYMKSKSAFLFNTLNDRHPIVFPHGVMSANLMCDFKQMVFKYKVEIE